MSMGEGLRSEKNEPLRPEPLVGIHDFSRRVLFTTLNQIRSFSFYPQSNPLVAHEHIYLPLLDGDYPETSCHLQYHLGRLGRAVSPTFLGTGWYGSHAPPHGLARHGDGDRGLRIRVLVGELRPDAPLADRCSGDVGENLWPCGFSDELPD